MKKVYLTIGILGSLIFLSIGLLNRPEQLGEVTNPQDIDYIAPIDFNGTEITYTYTDDNTGEDLIIATDGATYSSWDSAYVNFAIKNISGTSQNIKVQFLYNGGASASVIEEVVFDSPYQVTVDDYGKKDYACKTNWIATTTATLEGEFVYYQCGKDNTMDCDSVVGKTCTMNNEIIGTHQETRYKDVYTPITKGTVEDLKSLQTKAISSEFVAKEQVSNFIEAGQTKYYRALLKFNNNLVKRTGEWPEKTNGEFYINAHGDMGAFGSLDPWYNASWLYRKSITIDNTKVAGSADHTSFPVLVDLTDSDLQANAQADGDDILFTSADGTTKLDHEIEIYTTATGRLTAWVRIPTLDFDNDTVIYMYYGNSGATNQQNATGVWDSNYMGVWHLPDGTTLSATDSSSNGANGTITGATATSTGKIDGAGFFDGNDMIETTDTSSKFDSMSSGWTMSGWIKAQKVNVFQRMITILNSANSTYDQYLQITSGAKIQAGSNSSRHREGLTSLSTETWYYVVGVTNYTSAGTHVYLNGANDNNNVTGAPIYGSDLGKGQIGVLRSVGVNYFADDVTLDELRISNVVRSSGWIATEYNNQSATSTFYTIGTQETDTAVAVPDKNRRLLTI